MLGLPLDHLQYKYIICLPLHQNNQTWWGFFATDCLQQFECDGGNLSDLPIELDKTKKISYLHVAIAW